MDGRVKLHFQAAHVRQVEAAVAPKSLASSVGMSAVVPMAALPLLRKLTVPTGLDLLYNPKHRGNRGWI
jgi:hypothetical protein